MELIDQLTWLAPLIVAAAGLVRPRFALYGFAAFLPFFGFSPGGLYSEPINLAAIVVIALAAVRGHKPAVRYWSTAIAVATWLVVALAAMWPFPAVPATGLRGWARVADEISHFHSGQAAFAWNVLLALILGIGVAWSVLRLIPRERVWELTGAITVGLISALALGYLNRLGWVDLWTYRPSPRELDDPRLQSVFVDSRRFAEYLILVWPLGLAWVQRRWQMAWVSGAFVLTVVVAVAWTLQRGAWITMALQFLVLLFVQRARWRHWSSAAIVVGLVSASIVAAVPDLRRPLLERALSTSASSRDHFFEVSLALFRQRPILGWGTGSYANAYALEASSHGGRVRGADTAHNLPMQILAERGTVGALAFLFLFVVLALRVRPKSSSEGSLQRALALSALGLLAYGVFQYLLYLKVLEWQLWLFAALWIVSTNETAVARKLVGTGAVALTVAAFAALPFQQQRPWQQSVRWGFYGWEGPRPMASSPRAGVPGQRHWISERAVAALPREGQWLSFSIIDGHPRAATHESKLKVWVDGALALETEIPNRWSLCRIPVEPAERDVVVEFEVEPSFRPFWASRLDAEPRVLIRDSRRLGVVLRNDCGGDLCWDLPMGKRRAKRAGKDDVAACYLDP